MNARVCVCFVDVVACRTHPQSLEEDVETQSLTDAGLGCELLNTVTLLSLSCRVIGACRRACLFTWVLGICTRVLTIVRRARCLYVCFFLSVPTYIWRPLGCCHCLSSHAWMRLHVCLRTLGGTVTQEKSNCAAGSY